MFEKKKDETGVNLTSLQEAAPAAPAIPAKPLAVPPELLTPAAQAYMASHTASIIKELFAELKPVLEAARSNASAALTPEALVAAFGEAERIRRLPTEDEIAQKERMAREKAMMKEEVDTNRKNLLAAQENCLHRYVNGQLAVSAIGNYPDRQVRFICHKCFAYFEPRHWEVAQLPTRKNPKGTDSIVDAHPMYVQIFKEYQLAHSQQ